MVIAHKLVPCILIGLVMVASDCGCNSLARAATSEAVVVHDDNDLANYELADGVIIGFGSLPWLEPHNGGGGNQASPDILHADLALQAAQATGRAAPGRKLLHGCHSRRCRRNLPRCPRCQFPTGSAAGHCISPRGRSSRRNSLRSCRRDTNDGVNGNEGNEGNEGDEGGDGLMVRFGTLASLDLVDGDEGDEGDEGEDGDGDADTSLARLNVNPTGGDGDEGDDGQADKPKAAGDEEGVSNTVVLAPDELEDPSGQS